MKKIIFILIFILVTSLMFSEFYYFRTIDTWIQLDFVARIEPAYNGLGRKSGILIYLISLEQGFNCVEVNDETEVSKFLDYLRNRKEK